MTKLDAVNRILRRAGRLPVTALDTGSGSDAGQAERILDEVDLQVQSEGWTYNTIRDVLVSPDQNGNINPIPGVIHIDSDAEDRHINVVKIGNFLYNNTAGENTPTWTENIKVRYTLRFSFNCIPYAVRVLIAEEAALQFCELMGSERGLPASRIAQARYHLQVARTQARQYDNGVTNTNLFTTREAYQIRGRRPRVLRFTP